MRFKISRPRLPRVLLSKSEESAMNCNSSNTKTGINKVPSIKPVLQISAILPSIITLVSSNLYHGVFNSVFILSTDELSSFLLASSLIREGNNAIISFRFFMVIYKPK